MNQISFTLEIVSKEEARKYDGIIFSNCCFVRCAIDKEPIHHKEGFEDALIVVNELENSKKCSGEFLLFVCACGVADDGGWEKVKVTHKEKTIEWDIHRDELYSFQFDKIQYIKSVEKIITELENLDDAIEREPVSVLEPVLSQNSSY